MATISTRLDTSSPALKSSEQQQGHFSNHAAVNRAGFGKTLQIFWKMLFHKPRSTRPVGEIPVQRLTREFHDALDAVAIGVALEPGLGRVAEGVGRLERLVGVPGRNGPGQHA